MVLDVFGELDVRGSGGFETFWGSGRWREFETFGVGRVWDFLGFWTFFGSWTFGVREGLGLSGVLDVGESSRRSGSGGFGAFGVHWVRRIGCGAHRSWRIREPAAARQCVLSELEPRARTKQLASLLIGLLLGCRFAAGCGRVAWRWLVCWRVG
jgi:hypothetical protein